jgi:pyruvate,orthophosphate dikinase
VTIRLLDPPLHEFLPPLEGRRRTSACAAGIKQLQESNPMLGTRGCRLGLQWPGDLRDAGARDRPAARAVERAPASAARRDHAPLVAFAEELRRCAS